MQFIVDVIKALAWPAAIVAIVVFLRRPIVDILMQLASGLRRLRSGPSDAEFDRIVSQTKADNYRFGDIILAIVHSAPFQKKQVEKGQS